MGLYNFNVQLTKRSALAPGTDVQISFRLRKQINPQVPWISRTWNILSYNKLIQTKPFDHPIEILPGDDSTQTAGSVDQAFDLNLEGAGSAGRVRDSVVTEYLTDIVDEVPREAEIEGTMEGDIVPEELVESNAVSEIDSSTTQDQTRSTIEAQASL